MKRSCGAVTVVVLLLVYAAFDDITTDRATSFRVEYGILIAAAGWLAFVASGLLRRRQLLLGGVSALAIPVAIWAQRAVGQGTTPGWRPEYPALIAAYVWFWVNAIVLLTARRPSAHDRLDPAIDSLPHVSG